MRNEGGNGGEREKWGSKRGGIKEEEKMHGERDAERKNEAGIREECMRDGEQMEIMA